MKQPRRGVAAKPDHHPDQEPRLVHAATLRLLAAETPGSGQGVGEGQANTIANHHGRASRSLLTVSQSDRADRPLRHQENILQRHLVLPVSKRKI